MTNQEINHALALPPLPKHPPATIVDGRTLYTYNDIRTFARAYGQLCFDAGRGTVEPQKPVEDDTVDFLRGMMGMK